MIERYRDGRLPGGLSTSPAVAAAIAVVHDEVPGDLDCFDLTNAIDRIWVFVRELNRYVTEQAPWTIAKDPERGGELDQVLFDLADGLRAAAIALSAYLPETAPKILDALAQDGDLSWDRVAPGLLDTSRPIAAAAPLFPRIELAAGTGAESSTPV
jgi:methionyl-tRNA synthetase